MPLDPKSRAVIIGTGVAGVNGGTRYPKATVVIKMGRKRKRAASMAASAAFIPGW